MNDSNNFEKKLSGKLYTFFEWMAKIILLNAYFVLFSLLGLVIFGFGPSLYATYKIISLWKQDEYPKIFTSFFNEYRKNFIKANVVFLLYTFLGVILFFDLNYFLSSEKSFVNSFGLIISIIFIVISIISFFFIYPVKINTNLSWRNAFNFSVIIQLGYPIRILILSIQLLLVGFLSYIIPHIAPFFIFSLVIYIVDSSYQKISSKIKSKSNPEV